MESEEPKFEAGYSLRMARNFIYISYKEAGIEYNLKSHERSNLEPEFGNIPSGWNSGLFRYIDECIDLVNTVELAILMSSLSKKDNSIFALVILLSQIKSNCIAIRLVSNHGLDDQARILIRALYENCLAFSRAIVDQNFREHFHKASSLDQSNKFWHENLSKQKTEKFLLTFNEKQDKKCPLVMGDLFENMIKLVGVQAHPNYLFSSFHFSRRWSDPVAQEAMASNHEATSEFVLTNTCQVALVTLFFVSFFQEELGAGVNCEIPDSPNSILSRARSVDAVLQKVGKIAGLMSLMLMKWSNRQKSDFDPATHF